MVQHAGEGSHGSILSGNYSLNRLNSKWKSTDERFVVFGDGHRRDARGVDEHPEVVLGSCGRKFAHAAPRAEALMLAILDLCAIAQAEFEPLNRVCQKDSRSETLKTLALLHPQHRKRLHQDRKCHVGVFAAIQDRFHNLRFQQSRLKQEADAGRVDLFRRRNFLGDP